VGGRCADPERFQTRRCLNSYSIRPTEENVYDRARGRCPLLRRLADQASDLADVPLADDFEFTGPVASFDSAEGYRAMAREAGQAVTSFEVRRQFIDGDTVCSIIDWEMAIPGVGRMTSAELVEVKDGQIVRGQLIYDAEALRQAMAAANSGTRTE
jgi:SnoaL-like domain